MKPPARTLNIRPDPGGVVPRTAMVMAAGLGTRMRPLSVTRPKPLIQIGGTTFIDHVLDHLRAAGVARIVVNAHYLPDMLEAHLATHAGDLEVVVSDERSELLDTGGGLVRALPLIDADPFLCVNTDNIWIDGPIDSLKLMAQAWDDARMDVLMLLIPFARAHHHAGRGDFHLDQIGRLSRKKRGRVAPYVWTGIQMLSKRLIADPPARVFSTNVFWDRAIVAGRAYGIVHQGLWFDVGTPASVGRTEAMLADG